MKTTVIIPQTWAANLLASNFNVTGYLGFVSDQTNTSLTISRTTPLPPQENYDVLFTVTPVQNPNCGVGSSLNIGLVIGVVVGGCSAICIILTFFVILHVIVKINTKRKRMLLPVTATTVTATPISTLVVPIAAVTPVATPQLVTPVTTLSLQPNNASQTSQVNLLVI
jgi:hypothetical protein